MDKLTSFLAFILSTLFVSSAAASQAVIIANNLYNNEAASPGATQTSVKINFYTGASVLCDTRTLPYGGFVSIQPGVTGSGSGNTTCTASQLITSITTTPITASAQEGAIYGTSPVSYIVTNSSTTTQLTVSQTPASAPIFDTTNGIVVTPGALLIS